MKKTTLLASLLVSVIFNNTVYAEDQQTKTLTVRGKLTEKTAFRLMDTFVQNAGAKMDAYPYQDYKVNLVQIRGVLPQDVPALENALRKWIATKDYRVKPLRFEIARAVVSNNTLYMTGEHQINCAYLLRSAVTDLVRSLPTPSGRHYTVVMNRCDNFVGTIPVGDTSRGCGNNVSDLINLRMDQDNIIFNPYMFTVDIDSISLDVW